VPGDREHAGALGRLGPHGGERLTALVDDPREVGDRLDVVDDRRLLVEAEGGREVRRLEAGHAPVALEALDEGGLLADDVGARPQCRTTSTEKSEPRMLRPT